MKHLVNSKDITGIYSQGANAKAVWIFSFKDYVEVFQNTLIF